MVEWTDEELIGYCEIHCQTDVAAFHKAHIRRMMMLAGYAEPELRNEFYTMHDEMKTLCLKARENLKRNSSAGL